MQDIMLLPPAWGHVLKRTRNVGLRSPPGLLPPAWGHVLKQGATCLTGRSNSTLPPAWGHVLKLALKEGRKCKGHVAPRVGACIETRTVEESSGHERRCPPRGGMY